MERDSSTRLACFRQTAAGRRICRGGRTGGYQTWQKCLVAGANDVAGHRVRHPRLKELYRHTAGHTENSGRCLQLATGSRGQGIFPTEEETRRQEIQRSEAQPAWDLAHERDRRSVHPSETVDADVVLDRADRDLGEPVPRSARKAGPLETVSVAGSRRNNDQLARMGEVKGALWCSQEREVQAANAGPDGDVATATGPHAVALCGGASGAGGTHFGRRIVE